MGDTEEGVASYEAPELVYHAMADAPVYVEESEALPGGGFVYKTQCGYIVNEAAIGITDDPANLTCTEGCSL